MDVVRKSRHTKKKEARNSAKIKRKKLHEKKKDQMNR